MREKREVSPSIHFYLFVWTNYDAVVVERGKRERKKIARWAGADQNKSKKNEKENERKKQQTKCAAVVYMAAVLWLPDSKLCLPLLLVCVCVCILVAIEKRRLGVVKGIPTGRKGERKKGPWPETDPSKSIKTELAFLFYIIRNCSSNNTNRQTQGKKRKRGTLTKYNKTWECTGSTAWLVSRTCGHLWQLPVNREITFLFFLVVVVVAVVRGRMEERSFSRFQFQRVLIGLIRTRNIEASDWCFSTRKCLHLNRWHASQSGARRCRRDVVVQQFPGRNWDVGKGKTIGKTRSGLSSFSLFNHLGSHFTFYWRCASLKDK